MDLKLWEVIFSIDFRPDNMSVKYIITSLKMDSFSSLSSLRNQNEPVPDLLK